jgi:hypothetical protein
LPPNRNTHTSARYSGELPCAHAGKSPNGRSAIDPTVAAPTLMNPRRENMFYTSQ